MVLLQGPGSGGARLVGFLLSSCCSGFQARLQPGQRARRVCKTSRNSCLHACSATGHVCMLCHQCHTQDDRHSLCSDRHWVLAAFLYLQPGGEARHKLQAQAHNFV